MKEGILLVINDNGRRHQRSFGGDNEIRNMYKPLTKGYKKIRWIWEDSINYDKLILDAKSKNWDIVHKEIYG